MAVRRNRVVALGFAGAFILVFAAFMALIALAVTEGGSRFLMREATALASTPAQSIRIGAMSGRLIGRFSLEDVEIADAEGPWLAVGRARVEWRPWRLLLGEARITTLDIENVAWRRSPLSDDKPATGIPVLPVALFLEWAQVQGLHLAPAVAGAETHGGLEGRVHVGRRLLDLALTADWQGAATGSARVVLRLDGSKGEALLDAAVKEGPGGLIGHLADMPGAPGLELRVGGVSDGPRWEGTAHFDLGGQRALDANISLVAGALVEFGIRGMADLRAFGAGGKAHVNFAVAGNHRRDLAFDIIDARMESGAFGLTYAGALDVAAFAVNGRLEAWINDLAALPVGTEDVLGGRLTLRAGVRGTVTAPRIDAEFDVTNLKVDDVTAAALAGKIAAAPEGDGLSFQAEGTVRALDPDDADLAPLTAGTSGWVLHGRTEPGGAFALDRIALMNEAAELAVVARIEPDGRFRLISGGGTLHDLAPLSALVGVGISGRLDVTLAYSAETEGVYLGAFEAKASAFSAEDALVRAAMGTAPRVTGRLRIANDWSPVFENLSVAAPVPISGHVGLPGGGRQVEGELTAALDRDGPLLTVLHPRLAGEGRATVRLSGAVRDIAADVGLAMTKIRFGDGPPLALTAQVHARIGRDLRGDLHAEAKGAGLDLKARTRFARAKDRALRFAGLDIRGAGVSLTGDLTVAGKGDLLDGRLVATSDDFAPAGRLLGLDLGGTGKVAVVVLAPGNGRQRAAFEGDVRHFRFDSDDIGPLKAGHVQFDVALTDPLADPWEAIEVVGTASAENVQTGDVLFTRAKLGVSGPPKKLSLTIDAAGRREDAAFEVKAAALVAYSAEKTEVSIADLSGRVGKDRVVLERPVRVVVAGSGVEVDALALRVGDGRLAASLRRSGDRLQADVEADSFPLSAFVLLAPDFPLAGTLSAAAKIAGAADQPAGTFNLHVEGLRPPGAEASGPAGTLRADGRLGDGQLSAEAKMGGVPGITLEASLQVAGLKGFKVPDHARLRGQASGTADLAALAVFVPFGDDRVAGTLGVNLTLGGTAAAPQFSGQASLRGGRYEGALTGLVLTNVTAEATADKEGLHLRRLTADDGAGGRFTGRGTLRFAEAAPQIAFDLDFTSARVLRRDEAQITADGKLALTGLVSAPKVSGRFTVRQAEIRIPERLPTSVVYLDVTEINRSSAVAGERREVRAGSPIPIALDVAIEVPGRAFVRGRGLESEWKGAVKVTGTTQEPVLDGRLSLVRGRFDALGQRFTLTRGNLSFVPDLKDDALMDIVAEAKAQDITAQIQLGGRLSNPTVRIASVPALRRDEVLARVLFGKSVGQLSALQAVRLVDEARTLSGRSGSAGVLGDVRRFLGVDVLDVNAGSDQGGSPSISVGKYIAEGVYLSMDRALGAGSEKLKLEIELTPNLSVETDVGANAEGQAGVNWRWNY